jgi:hypothetical protein
LFHLHYYNYQSSKCVIRKKKDDETNVGGRRSDVANNLDLYEEEWRHDDKSSLTPKSVSCKLPEVSGKIPFHKQALIENANYLAEAMNKFVKGSINVKRHKLEFGERMTILLI